MLTVGFADEVEMERLGKNEGLVRYNGVRCTAI